MKKLIILALLVICGILLFRVKAEKKDETNTDLEKIKQVQAVCEKVVNSNAVYSMGDEMAKWYIFDLELMMQGGNEAKDMFVAELGSDFTTRLSNKDRLFVGFLPHRRSYRIYAGDPKMEGTMIYPDWEYEKVKPEE